MYRIREVDGTDDDVADEIKLLHDLTFFDIPCPDTDVGFWWLAYHDGLSVAFSCLVPSSYGNGVGYLKRSGVIADYRGNGLQRRLIRAREMKARALGWGLLVTDTTDNPASANTLISCGYRTFLPAYPWGFRHSIYWKKVL